MPAAPIKIGFLGFGEAAQAFAQGMQDDGCNASFCAYDIKTDGPLNAAKLDDYKSGGVNGLARATDILTGTSAVFSLVTADQSERAADALSDAELNNQLFLDCNSCAPETKKRTAKAINAAGGRYVDVAVMTPVHPKLHKSPCLLAGPYAQDAQLAMQALGMNTTIAGEQVGDASTRKMIRSTMIKGLEALTLECFLAARKAGIEDNILSSLDNSFPGFGWETRAPYMVERAVTHGTRRAAEMEEVVKTLQDLGIAPHMTTSTVQRQKEIGALGLNAADIGSNDLVALLDAILMGLTPEDAP